MDAAKVEQLEARLGHRFTKREILLRALTHRSLTNEIAEKENGSKQSKSAEPISIQPASANNERLEFLGDAVLGLVVAEALFEDHAEWQEGELTRIRAQLVSRKHMAEVAEALGLGEFLLLSKSEEKAGLRRKGTVLSNSMEAVIAALFLDGGLDAVRRFARKQILAEAEEQLAKELRAGAALGNYKSALQEHLQATHMGAPLYRLLAESGPDHRKNFKVEVCVLSEEGKPGKALARGSGNTKKIAEQDAARRALEKLQATEDAGRNQESEETA